MSESDIEVYAGLLSFLAIYLVELSSIENSDLPLRKQLSPKIKNYAFAYSGFSSRDHVTHALHALNVAKDYQCLYDAEEIKKRVTTNPRPDIISLNELLDAFVDICGSYGPCVNFVTTKPFHIRLGYENIFQVFKKHAYVQKSAKGYLWTDKIAAAMVNNSAWQSHSCSIQHELETESQTARDFRLNSMYISLPENIREFLQENRPEHELTKKLLENWNWKANKWGKSNAKSVTWIVYRPYVQGLQKLIANP